MTDKELFGNSEQLDTISRSVAIEAMNEYFSRIGKLKRRGLSNAEKAISLDTVGVIKTLPSAQPVAKDTNVPVKDCISRQAALDALDRLEYTPGEWATNGLTMCKDAIKALPSAQRWISVTEKLPKMTDTYLVQVGINENGEGMHTEVRTADWNAVWQTWYVHTTRCLVGDIIKWMPIPWEGSDRHEG